MRVLLPFILTLTAVAQEAPEIRGSVLEFDPNTGIAGATVTLIESIFKEPGIPRRLIATAVTDAQGRFSFKPGHYGDFYLEATMAGYTAFATGGQVETRVMAMSDEPRVITLTLQRPATLSGRFVDVDGKPISGLAVSALPAAGPRMEAVKTDHDGRFQFRDVPPGAYVIRPLPAASAVIVRDTFSRADVDAVDEDYESTYWPGGSQDLKSALPLTVNPAGGTDLGTIPLRRIAYHRLHVTLEGACRAGEQWTAVLLEAGEMIPRQQIPFTCSNQFLLRYVNPASLTLALFSGNLLVTTGWAMTQVTVARNAPVSLTLAPPLDLTGRITRAADTIAAKPQEFSIVTRSQDIVANYRLPVRPDEQGRFVIPGVAWSRHKLAIESQNPAAYVKEVRYAGQPVIGGALELVPGATLEVTIDDGAAAVTGKVAGIAAGTRAAIYLTQWPRGTVPPTFEPAAPTQMLTMVDAEGNFRIASLAPGEYRIAALAPPTNPFDTPLVEQVIARAQSIVLERGATKSIELKLPEVQR